MRLSREILVDTSCPLALNKEAKMTTVEKDKIGLLRKRYETYKLEVKLIPSKALAQIIYVNDVQYLLSEYERLGERQKWINEVARPDHPDDERPWCAAYLDCRARMKELEEGIEKHKKNRFRITDIDEGTPHCYSERLRNETDEELYKLVEDSR